MKASELRVGNWVNTPEGVYQVIDVLCDSVNTIAQHSLPYDWIEPIQLTPEILQKCGFEQGKGVMFWESEGVGIAYETLGGYFRLYPRTNRIDYLHQLQNLFHALTGEELNYQP